MILLDANVLVYAHEADLPEHARARGWLDRRLSGTDRVGMPWPSVLAFLRIVTNPRIFPHPEPIPSAWKAAQAWLSRGVVWVPEPTERHGEILETLLRLPGLRSNDVPDAHLATLALEHGLTLCSADSGFARFPGLRWENPLA